jgi:hypothetical protein
MSNILSTVGSWFMSQWMGLAVGGGGMMLFNLVWPKVQAAWAAFNAPTPPKA